MSILLYVLSQSNLQEKGLQRMKLRVAGVHVFEYAVGDTIFTSKTLSVPPQVVALSKARFQSRWDTPDPLQTSESQHPGIARMPSPQ